MLAWMQPYNKGRANSIRRHVEKMSRILHMLHIKHISWAVSSNCELTTLHVISTCCSRLFTFWIFNASTLHALILCFLSMHDSLRHSLCHLGSPKSVERDLCKVTRSSQDLNSWFCCPSSYIDAVYGRFCMVESAHRLPHAKQFSAALGYYFESYAMQGRLLTSL